MSLKHLKKVVERGMVLKTGNHVVTLRELRDMINVAEQERLLEQNSTDEAQQVALDHAYDTALSDNNYGGD